VAVIEGVSLYNVLRGCLIQTERGYSYEDVGGGVSSTLDYRKWELIGQTETTDIITYDLGEFAL
jgi:hypothetical protein